MKVTVIPIVIGALGTASKGLVKGQEGLEIRSPENLRLTVTQNPVEDDQLMLV